MKRRKPAIKRARRSTFDNSLNYATAKLDKCLARRIVLEKELEALKEEIPYLQTVIRALTPREERAPLVHDSFSPKVFTGMTAPRRAAAAVPASVAPFLEPISGNVDELPNESDKFLDGAKLPPGEDLLS
jgi:hypothetical protein